jgi:predicted MFS family arabinose efflux permease
VLSTFGFGIFIAGSCILDYFSCDAKLNFIPYYASAILIGFGNGHMWPAFQNMIIAIAHHNERGTANSTILTSWDFGLGLGILLGGIIAEYMGYDAMFWVMAGVHVVGLVMYVFTTQGKFKEKQKQFV